MQRAVVVAFALAMLAVGVSCAGGRHEASNALPATGAGVKSPQFAVPPPISAPVPPPPRSMKAPPPAPSNTRRKVLDASSPPPFFNGSQPVGSGFNYLQFSNGNYFGYFAFLGSNWIFHSDLGYLYYTDAADGQGGIDFFDQTTQRWWYTKPGTFPYLYDFTLSSWLWYDPDSSRPGHYTVDPRWFYQNSSASWIKLPDFGSIVWQTNGAGNLGAWEPVGGNGQCGAPQFLSGTHNVVFDATRNTSGTYSRDGVHQLLYSSTCYRNQLIPDDASNGTMYYLQPGAHYTVTFSTTVSFHQNTAYIDSGVPSGGWQADLGTLVFQTHSNTENRNSWGQTPTGPCIILLAGNTHANSTYYNNAAQPGQPIWQFWTCQENQPDKGIHPNPNTAYFSPDTLQDVQTDQWQIDFTMNPPSPQASTAPVSMRRNGKLVYNNPTAFVCDPNAELGCWWNFGPYPSIWENSEEPPGFTNPGITIEYDDMILWKR